MAYMTDEYGNSAFARNPRDIRRFLGLQPGLTGLDKIGLAAGGASLAAPLVAGAIGKSSKTRRKASSAASGALSGAGAGASLGSVIPGVGTAIGAGVGALVGAAGGALSPDENEMTEAERERLRLEEEQMAEDRRRFDIGTKQRQFEFGKQAGIEGIGILANQRAEAMQNMRRYNYRNDLLSAARGT